MPSVLSGFRYSSTASNGTRPQSAAQGGASSNTISKCRENIEKEYASSPLLSIGSLGPLAHGPEKGVRENAVKLGRTFEVAEALLPGGLVNQSRTMALSVHLLAGGIAQRIDAPL